MTEFVDIPKVVAARKEMEYQQKIPKIIWQTMKTNRLPIFMKNYADTWINLNPEYEYRFCDDEEVIDFIKTTFPDYLEGYKQLKFGASKADLWRYLIIYQYGGIYADIDCKCINPLREWVHPTSSWVTQLGTNKDICQWFIMSVPQNPIFLKAAEKTLENAKSNNNKVFYNGFIYADRKLTLRKNEPPFIFKHDVLGLSGPPVLQAAAEECYEDGSIKNLLPTIQIVCVSDKTSCQMNGNVNHDTGNEEYKKSYKILRLKHYNGMRQKIIRKLKNLFSFLSTF